jgi:hypothetical protein
VDLDVARGKPAGDERGKERTDADRAGDTHARADVKEEMHRGVP